MRTDHAGGYVVERGPNTAQVKAPMRTFLAQRGFEKALVRAAPGSRLRFVYRAGKLVPVPLSPLRARDHPAAVAARQAPRAGGAARPPQPRRRGVGGGVRGKAPGERGGDGPGGPVPHRCVRRRRDAARCARGVPGSGAPRRAVRIAGPRRDRGRLVRTRARRAARLVVGAGGSGAVRAPARRSPGGAARAREPRGRDRARRQQIPGGGHERRPATCRSTPRAWCWRRPPRMPRRSCAAWISEAAEVVAGVRYAPIATVPLGVRAEDVRTPVRGFGFLVPREENLALLGCLFMSQLFSGRAPEGHELLHCMLGGVRWPDAADAPGATLVERAVADLDRTLGLKSAPESLGVGRMRAPSRSPTATTRGACAASRRASPAWRRAWRSRAATWRACPSPTRWCRGSPPRNA